MTWWMTAWERSIGTARTKHSLRHVCRATYSSSAINSDLGSLELGLYLPQDGSAVNMLFSACHCYPKYAALKRLHLDFCRTIENPPGSTVWLACADDDRFTSRLGSVRELCMEIGIRGVHEVRHVCRPVGMDVHRVLS